MHTHAHPTPAALRAFGSRCMHLLRLRGSQQSRGAAGHWNNPLSPHQGFALLEAPLSGGQRASVHCRDTRTTGPGHVRTLGGAPGEAPLPPCGRPTTLVCPHRGRLPCPWGARSGTQGQWRPTPYTGPRSCGRTRGRPTCFQVGPSHAQPRAQTRKCVDSASRLPMHTRGSPH